MDISDYILLHTTGNLYWKDKKGCYLGCNLEFAKIAGLNSPQEIVGQSDKDLFLDALGEEGVRKLVELDQYVISNDIEQVCEEVGLDIAGNIAYYMTKKIPLKDANGDVIGLIGNSLDITESKRKEEELRNTKERMAAAEVANKAKAEFLEKMQHDTRTPLMGIIGFAEMVKNEVVGSNVNGYVDNILASSHALLDLLNGILEAVKVSSGEIPLLKKRFSLQENLNEVILLNQAKAHQKNIELLFEYDSAIPTYLIGDSTRIHRVALELVTNALKFTNKGYVRLSVHLAKDTGNDVVIKMVVEDSGIGIEPEKQQDIYVRFKRLTPSYEGICNGLGLGLSIAKQFIDDLKGELYVESQVGVGSKFTANIKLKKPLLDESLSSEDVLPMGHKGGIASA